MADISTQWQLQLKSNLQDKNSLNWVIYKTHIQKYVHDWERVHVCVCNQRC